MAGQKERVEFSWDSDAFDAALQEAFAEMRLTSMRQLKIMGVRVANRAKQFCPVATGRLRTTIGTSDVGEDMLGLYIDVGVSAADLLADGAMTNYAPYVEGVSAADLVADGAMTNHAPYVQEFGTSKTRPQPFMRPALAEVMGLDG